MKKIIIFEMGKHFNTKKSILDKYEMIALLDNKVKKVIYDDKFPVYRPSKGLEIPDCVVVTAIYYFDEIKEELKGIGFENIISIKDMVIKNDRAL